MIVRIVLGAMTPSLAGLLGLVFLPVVARAQSTSCSTSGMKHVSSYYDPVRDNTVATTSNYSARGEVLLFGYAILPGRAPSDTAAPRLRMQSARLDWPEDRLYILVDDSVRFAWPVITRGSEMLKQGLLAEMLFSAGEVLVTTYDFHPPVEEFARFSSARTVTIVAGSFRLTLRPRDLARFAELVQWSRCDQPREGFGVLKP